ncbi:unnamed protein product, partial [Mesorhabditis spiculigera]
MFWTPNTKDEQLTKLSIGLTSMMSMTIFVQMVSEQIPRTSTFPLLGIFVIVCVAIISFACVVLIMFSARPREKERKVEHWVQADFNGIERFWLAYDQVWIPENSILECSSVSEAWPDYRRPVRVQSSGRVFLDTQQIVTIACPMDLGTFPFDSQLCPINFGLPSYMVNQVSMTGELFDFDYKSTSGMGEWSVTNITMIQYQIPSEISPMDVVSACVVRTFPMNIYSYASRFI